MLTVLVQQTLPMDKWTHPLGLPQAAWLSIAVTVATILLELVHEHVFSLHLSPYNGAPVHPSAFVSLSMGF